LKDVAFIVFLIRLLCHPFALSSATAAAPGYPRAALRPVISASRPTSGLKNDRWAFSGW
jgi:hypothetical protein